jgi:D-alanyl-D-alanine carboxypeptidase
VTFLTVSIPTRAIAFGLTLLATGLIAARPACAEATLIVEADSGKVLHAEHATYPWYPASITKLMTAYVILRAIKERRITLDSLFTATSNAVAQGPTKMGFGVGTTLTVDNALKMLMVKSANDVAVVLAEGLSGSIEKFADEMNLASKRLGMTQSSWVNPNGLPADEQITSARDMAILARALILEFPEYEMYWRIPAIQYGRRTMPNHNGLMGYYPGTDGMKTGFICASGFNVVATASRNGRRLIVIVLGSPSGGARTIKAAQLFEKGFNGSGLSWLMPSLGTVDALQPIAAAPPNLRDETCGGARKRMPSEEAESDEIPTTASSDTDQSSAYAVSARMLRDRLGKHTTMLGGTPPPPMPPVVVYLGPSKNKGQPLVAARSGKRKGTTAVAEAPAARPPRTATASMLPSFNLAPTTAAPPPAAFVPASAESTPVTMAPASESPDGVVPVPRPRPKRHAAKGK